MALPTQVPLPSCVRGDTWDGFALTITVNGVAPAAAAQSVRMQFRPQTDSYALGCELSTAASSITIVDANAWSFVVPAQILPLDAGLWDWDFETTDVNGVVKTYVGGTLTLAQDVTR